MELAKTGWVDVVKRNTRKELKDENIVNTTLEEEKCTQGIDARLSFSVLFFLLSFDVLNLLIKIEKWAKEIKAENKKDKEEKELFIADVAHLKVDNVNLQK